VVGEVRDDVAAELPTAAGDGDGRHSSIMIRRCTARRSCPGLS
jgi:hypothetical protein